MRTTPKFDGRVIAHISKNNSYPVVGCTKDQQWWQILALGVPAWVSATSVKVTNTQGVPNTYIGEGGLPSAQEIYFMVALGQHRDRLKQTPNRTRLNDTFLSETAWVDQQRVVIPTADVDPEYLTPAEGAVGMMERTVRSNDPEFRRNRTIAIGIFISGFLLGLLFPATSIFSIAGVLAFWSPLVFLIYRWRMARNFSHNRYYTKSQQARAQMRNNATVATAVGATVAAGALYYSVQRGKKTGQPVDLAKGIGSAIKLAEKVAPTVAVAAPAMVAALAANKAAANVKENQLVKSQVAPIIKYHTFISYRRVDAQPVAEWLYNELNTTFAQGGVFFDKEEIPIGVDFRAILNERMTNCKVVIVVMGPQWVAEMKRRQTRPDEFDFVKEEIAEALRRKLCIIPLRLTDGETLAPWPREDDLPIDIALLAHRNAMEFNIKQPNVAPLVSRINEELAKHIILSSGASQA
ncbi:MAG: toll/interleukin-1 receptor domain-containing protein [Armatimonadetes bacterium]|nr:toll/interleukin-1 receptor domain-containing protein [Anaerolineae bacterium]